MVGMVMVCIVMVAVVRIGIVRCKFFFSVLTIEEHFQ